MAPTRPLAWEPPCATVSALKSKKKKKKKKGFSRQKSAFSLGEVLGRQNLVKNRRGPFMQTLMMTHNFIYSV